MSKQLLLISSSRSHPHRYLEHCESEVLDLFADADDILFVPYARPAGHTHDEYTGIARKRFERMGKRLTGIHEHADPQSAVASADGVFIGGGNTFVLLHDLYKNDVVVALRDRINSGMPYMGTSAGSNVAGLSIGTSNDMPIVHPPSFDAIGAVPFNINPHYPIAPPDPTHKGETRDDRIREFHVFNLQPVIALHEDGMLRIRGDDMSLIGERDALLFQRGRETEHITPGPIPPEALHADLI